MHYNESTASAQCFSIVLNAAERDFAVIDIIAYSLYVTNDQNIPSCTASTHEQWPPTVPHRQAYNDTFHINII